LTIKEKAAGRQIRQQKTKKPYEKLSGEYFHPTCARWIVFVPLKLSQNVGHASAMKKIRRHIQGARISDFAAPPEERRSVTL
jgi:hypothetical protein